jgi:hypothetical protein
MPNYTNGRDAAFPQNLFGYDGIIIGYFGGAGAFHVWQPADWTHFKNNYKIPTWVAPVGAKSGSEDANKAVTALRSLGVPPGKVNMLDMEEMKDDTYVTAYGNGLHAAGYKTWVYGSTFNLFRNPPLNGYAVADPTGILHMYNHPAVRMTQYAFGPSVDHDLVKEWLIEQDDLWQ